MKYEPYTTLIGYEYDENKQALIEVNPEAKNLWAIWKRGYINSCSNALESRHGHINTQIKQYKNIVI